MSEWIKKLLRYVICDRLFPKKKVEIEPFKKSDYIEDELILDYEEDEKEVEKTENVLDIEQNIKFYEFEHPENLYIASNTLDNEKSEFVDRYKYLMLYDVNRVSPFSYVKVPVQDIPVKKLKLFHKGNRYVFVAKKYKSRCIVMKARFDWVKKCNGQTVEFTDKEHIGYVCGRNVHRDECKCIENNLARRK